jgi:predicted nucleotide-binding protein (sugar kinase/HSP70/actin superfamily)
VIEEIIEISGKPHFSFRDLDENRPLASIRIRVETMHYFLRNYREQLNKNLSEKLKSPAKIAALPVL